MSAIERFYEDLSPYYHLLFEDWDRAVAEQGRALDRLIAGALGSGLKRVLDAACGIGTQAIGLALEGHEVVGSDISQPALDRAARESARLGAEVTFQVADMRRLLEHVAAPFDVAMAMGNALAHFHTPADLAAVVAGLADVLAPGGLFMVSIRGYDRLLRDRPKVTPVRVADDAEGCRISFQIWDWEAGGADYSLTQFILLVREAGVETLAFRARVHALTRAELEVAAMEAGLGEVRWHEAEESGFYEPILTARRSGA